jgi:DNA modification methylase
VAAENERRVCYGMEVDPGYCAVILQRMTDMGLAPHRVTRDEAQ